MSAPEAGRPDARRLTLLLRNDPAELTRLHEWLDDLARAMALPQAVTFAADLCLQEAVVNVISYAFADARAHEIRVSIARDACGLVLEVEDDGRAFDPLGVAPHVPAERIEDAAIGGLGIHLIREFAADVRYARENGKNRLTMVVGVDEAPA